MKYILFPHTDFFSLRHLPFFLLTRQIQIFRVTAQKTEYGLTDCFMKAGFCQAELLPFTDSDEESRFLDLVEELHRRPHDFPHQLSMLTVAGRTVAPEDGEQSNRAIRKTIEEKPQSVTQQEQRGSLWQARLLLCIGEIIDQQEEEVAAQLSDAERSTRELIAELQGDREADPLIDHLYNTQDYLYFADHKGLAPRIKAWRQLFAKRVQPEDILLAPIKDTAEQLIEEYETETKKTGSFTGELLLPAVIGDTAGEALENCRKFHNKYAALQEKLLAPLWSEEFRRQWDIAIDDIFPIQLYGRQKIAGISFDQDSKYNLPYPQRIFHTAQ